jgi:hypothetical protein
VTLGPGFSVLRSRTAVAEELRRLLPKMEGVRKAAPIPFGLPAIDRYLPQGGLAGGALHEIVPAPDALSAAFGFVVALLARLARECNASSMAHKVSWRRAVSTTMRRFGSSPSAPTPWPDRRP